MLNFFERETLGADVERCFDLGDKFIPLASQGWPSVPVSARPPTSASSYPAEVREWSMQEREEQIRNAHRDSGDRHDLYRKYCSRTL